MRNEKEFSLYTTEINRLIVSKDYGSALDIADQVVRKYPMELSALRKKADILSLMSNVQESLLVRTRLHTLNSQEPADYYDLARHSLSLGQNSESVKWCRKGLELCEWYGDEYYKHAFYFYLANALYNMSIYKEAVDVANKLPLGYQVHLGEVGNRTKEDLLKLCEQAGRRRAKKIFKFE